jgi:4-amino-4-deoxy-L-arabinose transferase-like glycosyltransferase
MCSTFEVWPSDPVRSAVTAQRVAPLEIPCIEDSAGSFYVGAVRCTLLPTYSLQPTALRAPGYPALLAVLMSLFGDKYVLAIRWIQFVLGLGTVLLCSRASARAFGKRAGRATLVIGLFFPTLIFVTAEVLTECIGAFLAALFLYLVTKEIQGPRMTTLVALGVVTGVAAVFRFNMAGLGFVGLSVACLAKASRPTWQRVLAFSLFAGMAISPWLIRNQIAFQEEVLYSSTNTSSSARTSITTADV